MGDRKQKDFVGPIILIVLGVLLLLNTTGVVPWEAWESLWRFWPVLLILWGISTCSGAGPDRAGSCRNLLALFSVRRVQHCIRVMVGLAVARRRRSGTRALPYSKTLTVSLTSSCRRPGPPEAQT